MTTFVSLTEILHYLRLGGVTLGILVLASFAALAVAVERILALWGISERSRALGEGVIRHLLRDEVSQAKTLAERSPVVTADLYLAGFGRLDGSKGRGPSIETAVQRERLSVGLKLKRNMWILGTVGAVSPFVGL